MLSHHRTLIFVFVVGRLFFVHCLQPGHANLGGCLKFFAGLDFEEIMSKKASATLTGRMLRNQLYYEFATSLPSSASAVRIATARAKSSSSGMADAWYASICT